MSVSTIAIDGPAASGKSAIGSAVASQLGFRFLDTGAMYRAVTWLALRRGVDLDDAAALTEMTEAATLTAAQGPEGTTVAVDGADATPHLRDTDVEAHVSVVSRVPGVRAALVQIQRALAEEGRVVMAGRDIGTVVLPDADLKVFLDATREVRARRRAQQVRRGGYKADIVAIREELGRRDDIDSSREASPLTAPADAVIINTDELSIEEVVRRIEALARG